MKPLTSSMLMKKIKDKSADIGTFLGPANREFWAMGSTFVMFSRVIKIYHTRKKKVSFNKISTNFSDT